MDETNIISVTKSLGCCDLCCLRYIGLKNHKIFEDPVKYLSKHNEQLKISSHCLNLDAPVSTVPDSNAPDSNAPDSNAPDCNAPDSNAPDSNAPDSNAPDSNAPDSNAPDSNAPDPNSNKTSSETQSNSNATIKREISKEVENEKSYEPPLKKQKTICVSCLGILQEEYWSESIEKVKQVLEERKYKCDTFACGLSAPMAVILRERAITAVIKNKISDYDEKKITPLKEAWKWSFCDKLSENLKMVLDSGSVAPLLISINFDYDNDLEEMRLLSSNPNAKPNRRWCERQCDELGNSKLSGLMGSELSSAQSPAYCKEVITEHTPVYLGGRYIKLSRELSQTPWLIKNVRMMESSVQDICFQPIADLFNIDQSARDTRLKLLSAGREDVDVRCLGNGRPFCVEVSDPRYVPSNEDLQTVADEISKDGRVIVKKLQVVTKDDLTVLKQGEETKCKTYEALCIKLSHNKTETSINGQANYDTPITVTQEDIDKMNSFSNSDTDGVRINILQKTPIRVLHRRPMLTRPRIIHSLEAFLVPDHPNLFRIKVVTSAGTYVKEWVHGELGRTTPSVKDILNCQVDILALDVTDIHLLWP